jgi:hypothetical protein
LPNTFSQFCQNFGFVPVRTIGPPTDCTSQGIASRTESQTKKLQRIIQS